MRLLVMTTDKELGTWIVEEARAKDWIVGWAQRYEDVASLRRGLQPNWIIWDVDSCPENSWMQNEMEGRRIFLLKRDLDPNFIVSTIQAGISGICPTPQMNPAILEARLEGWQGLQNDGAPEKYYPRFDLHVDGQRQIVRRGADRLRLTSTECRILNTIIDAVEATVDVSTLKIRMARENPAEPRSVYVHMCSLRKKLKKMGVEVESIRGIGYRLKPCPKSRPVLDSGDATPGQV